MSSNSKLQEDDTFSRGIPAKNLHFFNFTGIPGSCPPDSTGASRRPGAHINCRSGAPTLHTSYMSNRKATLMDQQLADLSQLLGATEAKKRMADIIVDRMAASYSAHCDSNEAFVYR